MSGVGYYGCKRDTHDHRDLKKVYDMVPSSLQHPNVDLRGYVHHVYDQGNLGSCTANAVCAAYGFDLKKQSQALVLGHRKYSYFCLLYTSPSPRDATLSRMPSSA